MQKEFAELQSAYYKETDRLSPLHATDIGIHAYDHELDAFSYYDLQKQCSIFQRWQKILKAFDASSLDIAAQIEYLLLHSEIDAQLRWLKKLKSWQTNPDYYAELAIYSVYLLLSREWAPLKDRIPAIISRMNLIPELLAQAKINLDNPPEIFTLTAIETVSGGLDFFTQAINEAAQGLPGDWQEKLYAAQQKTLKAFGDYKLYLEEYLLPLSRNHYAIGKKMFEEILQREHFLDYNCEQLWELGHKLFAETQAELEALAHKLLPKAACWQDALTLLEHELPEPGKLLQAYRSAVDKAKAYVVQHDIVAIPENETLKLIETPAFFRSTIPYAAYLPPAPYEQNQMGEFWVTPIDPGLSPQAQLSQLKEHSLPKICYTVLHEAYPGHHLQLSYMHLLSSDTLKRSHSNLFVEGWAFYCEAMIKEQGFLSRSGELCQLKDQLWRAARIILDVGLHTGKLTFNQAVTFLESKVALSHASACSEVRRYTQTPTQPSSYYLGKLEILKMRQLLSKLPLKDFHQLLLQCGSIPPPLLPYMLKLEKTSPLNKFARF